MIDINNIGICPGFPDLNMLPIDCTRRGYNRGSCARYSKDNFPYRLSPLPAQGRRCFHRVLVVSKTAALGSTRCVCCLIVSGLRCSSTRAWRYPLSRTTCPRHARQNSTCGSCTAVPIPGLLLWCAHGRPRATESIGGFCGIATAVGPPIIPTTESSLF